MQVIEYELAIGGVAHWREARIVPSGDGEVVAITRDFTEQRRTEAEQQRLAAEQAALRRVATLVAGNAPPEEVFQTVTEEVCRLLGLRTAVLHRFEDARTSTIVGKFGELTGPFELGNVIELEVGSALQVLQTGAPARSNYDELAGPGAAELRALGFSGSVGVPITVAGVTWGALVVALRPQEPLPLETERRLQAFAELVGLAVASASARDELAASRLRIVEASDTERRRIERNLHDGAQQRLVALVARAPGRAGQAAHLPGGSRASCSKSSRRSSPRRSPSCASSRRGSTRQSSPSADSGLRSRCWRPGHRSRSSSTSRSPNACPNRWRRRRTTPSPRRSPTSSSMRMPTRSRFVSECFDGRVEVEISDNGVGGADPDRGSGLRGLRDRVEALDGELWVESSAGSGHARARRAPRPLGQPRNRREGRVTLTFFFSDIEDSSGLADRLGGGYAAVLSEARELQRRAVERAGGREVDSRGDELFGVFDGAAPAAAAALEIQRALISHVWPAEERVRVRVGLHCGEAERAGDGFVGLDVHRASRICQAAHGGQVLASKEAVSRRRRERCGSSASSSSGDCASRSGSSSSSPTTCPPSSRRSATSASASTASPR